MSSPTRAHRPRTAEGRGQPDPAAVGTRPVLATGPMARRCPVCSRSVEPDPDGTVRVIGLAPREAPRLWVWGPAVVHDECRYDVTTPFDDRTGYLPVEQRVQCGAGRG